MTQKTLSEQERDHLRVHFEGRRESNLLVDVYRWLRAFGLDPLVTLVGVRETVRFFRQARNFKQMSPLETVLMRPQLQDRLADAGSCSGHYFWQDLLVAREINRTNPNRHVDVGSRVDGLVSHLLSFRDVEVVDIRSLSSEVQGLKFIQDDGMTLAKIPTRSVESLSSLHAVEHFGLGRYGDPIVPDGHLRGMRSLARVLAPGGSLWISFPIGKPQVEFNGQRVVHPETALQEMPSLTLIKFTGIPADGQPVENIDPKELVGSSGWCGLYEFRAN